MLLTVDIGNTNLTIGAYSGEELKFVARLATDRSRTEHCIKCGACLPKCPQHIDIRSMMSTICDTL